MVALSGLELTRKTDLHVTRQRADADHQIKGRNEVHDHPQQGAALFHVLLLVGFEKAPFENEFVDTDGGVDDDGKEQQQIRNNFV